MGDWSLTRTFSFQGQIIRYDVRGNGPPVVLVHGTPWSSFNWRHLIPHLAKDWTVYFYDLLGYGQSEMKEGQDVSLGIQNRVLAAFLDYLELDAPKIIGHDFGGTTVLRTHLLGGRDFERILVCNPVALSPWGSPFFAHVNRHESAFSGVPEYIHEAIVIAYVKGAMRAPMSMETLEGILRPWRGDMGRRAFYRQIAQADRHYTDEIEPLYGQIDRPVLIAWGEKDDWIPIERGRQLNVAIPGSKLVPIPAAGHLVQEDQPQVLLEVIRKFLL